LLTPEMVAAANVKPHSPEHERRKVRRLRLSMRIRVRNVWGVTDICQTRDVSKVGLCFLSTQIFSVRDEVFITLPFADQQVPVETKSTIIWSAAGTAGRFYGVSYMK